MNIDEMTDQEKSVMLARAMGWKGVFGHGYSSTDSHAFIHWAFPFEEPDFYAGPMHAAWRVLNWANVQAAHITNPFSIKFDHWCYWSKSNEPGFKHLTKESPADAQRLWLDKILELAIEAGLIPD